MTPPGCSRPRSAMTTPAGRCCGRRRWRRPPGTSSTPTTATRRGPRSPRAVEVYTSLGAAADVARLQADVPRPRHPARAARQAPAGAERLGQPHGDRDQDRRVRGGGAVQPGDRGPAAAIPPDRRHARLPHPQEAQRQLADRHSQGVGPAHHPAEVTQPGSEVTRPGNRDPLEPRGRGAGFQGNSVGTVRRRGNDSQSPRLSASVAPGRTGLEREREVHGFARRGAVDAPGGRQAGDQHQAPSGLRVG